MSINVSQFFNRLLTQILIVYLCFWSSDKYSPVWYCLPEKWIV